MAGIYEGTDRFRLTTVKMEELLSMVGPFYTRKTTEVCFKWESVAKNSTALARYRRTLSFSGCPGTVCLMPMYVFLFSSLTEDCEGVSVGNTDIGNCVCCWCTNVSSGWKQSSPSKPCTEGQSFPRYPRWGVPFLCTSPSYLLLFHSFLHCLLWLKSNTENSFAQICD